MKKYFIIGSATLFFGVNTTFAQDILQNQVPSLVVNSFQQAFPQAFDVEWEMHGDRYKAEFETGLLGTDHEARYDQAGKLVWHKEEISKGDLPQKVTAKISSDFRSYIVDDVRKITEGDKATYTMEFSSFTEEWKVAFDQEGNILSKVAD